jgi:ankyrin repeat protein
MSCGWRVTRETSPRCSRALIEAGADVNGVGDGSSMGDPPLTPITLAGWRGRLDCVRALIAAGAEVDNVLDEDDTTLSGAARGGHTQVVQCLLEAGASQDVGGYFNLF